MRWHATYAWLPGGLARDVSIEAQNGKFTAVTPGTLPGGHEKLPGLVLPGMANAHSHAFHRALRGRTSSGVGSFWTWREQMYRLANRIDPDQYFVLARAAYAEMALAGITVVGEFHYLHHQPSGLPYENRNAMGDALIAAATEAGIRMTLLDTCYLTGGLTSAGHDPLDEVQRRFSDGDVAHWAERVEALRPNADTVVGTGVHSIRAVPLTALSTVVAATGNRPLHFHVSEQRVENEACQKFYRMTPIRLFREAGVLGPRSTAVHASHLAADDLTDLAETNTAVCACPTTERDLGDGRSPALCLTDAGVPLCFGSDQHVTTDLLEEARTLEMDERMASEERGRFSLGQLVEALTSEGHRRLGWEGAGRLEVGAKSDLVAIRLDTVRTAGVTPEQAVLVASAADIDTVVVGGRTVVRGGSHRLGDIGQMLSEAIEPLWSGK
jgi:formiminoglutamate deiminase